MKTVCCIMGPTASGKTDLSIALAKQYPIEIINVDSAQIYQGMDIGSGKPDIHVRESIPHHLIDFLDPSIAYSAAQFRVDAIACINDILSRNKIPLLVGGTMLYFKALQQGLSILPSANAEIRNALLTEAALKGWEELHVRLLSIDPVSAQKIKPTDPQRIQRALEVYEITGKPLSYWLAQPKKENDLPCTFKNIAFIPIRTPRQVLHQRITERFDKMLSEGLVKEVEKLLMRRDLNESMPSMRACGYRQVYQYLTGKLSYDEMCKKAIVATCQLAKRQLTWIRQWPEIIVLDFQDPERLQKLIAFSQNHFV